MRSAAQRLLGIRAGESGLLLRTSALVAAATAAQVLSLGASTAILLGSYSKSALPVAYAVSAVLGILLSVVMSAAAGRVSRTAEAAGAFLLFGLSLAAGRLALPFAPWLALALQPWAQVGSSLVLVQAYGLAGEHMDGVQARRLLPLVGAGGTVGACLAGLLMAKLTARVGTANLLLFAAAAALAGAAVVGLVARRDRPVVSAPARKAAPAAVGPLAGLRALGTSRLLFLLAVSVATLTIASTVVRFAFEAALQDALPPERIAAFFGGYIVVLNAALFAVQTGAEARMFRAWGLTFARLVAPLVLAGGALLLAVAGVGLWLASGVRLAESVARFSLGRTGEDLVVAPVPALDRRRARVVITGLVIPVATLAAAGILALARVSWPPLAWIAGVATAVASAVAVLAMRRPYIESLKAALQERRIKLGRRRTLPGITPGQIDEDLRRELRSLTAARLLEAADEPAVRVEAAVHRRAAEERLFRLSSLVGPPHEMTRAWLAYASGDRNARAFALELLRHELPAPMARVLLPYLEDPTLEEMVARARAELAFPHERATPWSGVAAASDEPWQRWLALRYGGAPPRDEAESSMRELLEEMAILRKVPLFSQLTADELRPIAEASEEIEVAAETVLFRQGEPGDAFYIVLGGKLRVERDGRRIAAIGDHECFGELALLDRGLRTATVIAETPCELSVISSEDFDDLLSEHPSIARSMLAILARRLTATDPTDH